MNVIPSATMIDYRTRISGRISREAPDLAEILSNSPVRGDHDLNGREWVDPADRPTLRLAAVLVPIVEHAHGPTVLLTRRA